jgi:hypothetical protein
LLEEFLELLAVASVPRRRSRGERGREAKGSEEAGRRCGEVASSGATRRGWSGRSGRSSERCSELRRSARRWRWRVSSAVRVDGEGEEGVALRRFDHAERMAVGEGGGGAGAGGAKVSDSRRSARGAAATAGGGRLAGVAMARGFGLELGTDTTMTTTPPLLFRLV